jgi:hypothetical protein
MSICASFDEESRLEQGNDFSRLEGAGKNHRKRLRKHEDILRPLLCKGAVVWSVVELRLEDDFRQDG